MANLSWKTSAIILLISAGILLLVFRGESLDCRLISTASMLEWLRPTPPHHSQGSSTERLSQNTLRMVTARVAYILSGSLTYILVIQWRRQRHLTWSSTHDVVSREINPWKSFDLLLGSNLWPLSRNVGFLTARPLELTSILLALKKYNTCSVIERKHLLYNGICSNYNGLK